MVVHRSYIHLGYGRKHDLVGSRLVWYIDANKSTCTAWD
jgi:hypothetical protein